jgi:hypothetical protein
MPTDVTREEFSQFQARVEVVEREVDGEKLVTRYILEQTRRNGDDLAAIKGRLDRFVSAALRHALPALRRASPALKPALPALRPASIALRPASIALSRRWICWTGP